MGPQFLRTIALNRVCWAPPERFIAMTNAFTERDWDIIRRHVSHHRKLLPLAMTIRACLESEAPVPPDILHGLFEKTRPFRKRRKLRRVFPYDGGDTLELQLFYVICRYDLSGDETRGIAEEVFRSSNPTAVRALLQEHKLYYNNTSYPRGFSCTCVQSVMDQELSDFEKLDSCRKFVYDLWANLLLNQRHFSRDDVATEEEAILLAIECLDDLKQCEDFFRAWQNTESLVAFSLPDPTPFLHGLVRGGYPSVLIWLASKVYPDQLYQQDTRGRVPLHYAASEPDHISRYHVQQGHVRRFQFTESFCRKAGVNLNRVTNPELLTKVAPRSASCPDGDGKLPLTAYIEHFSIQKRGSPDQKDIMHLIKASPRALTRMDPESFLLPFMVAARGSDNVSDLAPDLSTVYTLLREDPTVLSLANTDGASPLFQSNLTARGEDKKAEECRIDMEVFETQNQYCHCELSETMTQDQYCRCELSETMTRPQSFESCSA